MISDYIEERILLENVSYYIQLEHISRYVFASKFAKHKTVLDIACGAGYGSNLLLTYGAEEVLGLDLSRNVIVDAKKRYKGNFVCMGAAKLGIRSNVFDVVCSFETIEHIKDYKEFLLETQRTLKPTGIFIVSTPLKEVWSPYTVKPVNPFHVKEFSQKELLSILKKYFTIVELYGQGYSVLRRFLLYFFEVAIRKIFGIKRADSKDSLMRSSLFYRLIETLRSKSRLRKDSVIVPFKKSHMSLPKYIIVVCENNRS